MSILRTLFLSALMVSSVGIFADDDNPAEERLDNTKEDLEQEKGGVISGVGSNLFALVCLPISFIDYFGEKLLVKNGIGKFAALMCSKNNRLGSWLTKHSQGLSRAIIVAAVGSAVYCCWKKNQESKEEQDRVFRMNDTENFDYFSHTTEYNDDNVAESA